MERTIDYYFSPASPWSWLGHERFARMAREAGVTVNVKPVDYRRVFPASGGLPLKQRAAQRQAYRLVELARWREHLGVPLKAEPKFFPVDADPSSLLIIAVDAMEGSDKAMDAAAACMRACWVEDRDIADAAVLADIVRDQGWGAGLIGGRAQEVAQAQYDSYTAEAIVRGVFGAPTYVYRDELFWGQDRLDFLQRALLG